MFGSLNESGGGSSISHDMLKAKALPLGIPIQMVRPSTFDRKLRSKEKDAFARSRSLQDEATCAGIFL